MPKLKGYMVISNKFINMHDPCQNNFSVRICTIYAQNYSRLHVTLLFIIREKWRQPIYHSRHVLVIKCTKLCP